MKENYSVEKSIKLLKAWRENKDREALNLLIISNTGLVIYHAKKYLGNGLSLDELKSAGYLGLLNAVNHYNYEEKDNYNFVPYVSVAIKNTILNDLRKYRKHSYVLSLSEPVMNNDDNYELTLEDIISTDPDGLIDKVIDDMKIDIVKDSLKSLTSREQKIIILRYGLDDMHRKTQKEVAELFGCSPAIIAKQENKALVKMRHPKNTRKLINLIED